MAAAASIPASLVRLPLWYACSNPRLIVASAFSVARGWRFGAEGGGGGMRVGNRCEGLSEGARRDSQTERSVRGTQRMSDSEFHAARFDS